MGTDGWGHSDTRGALRRHFLVDAESIVVQTLAELARRGEVDPGVVQQAIDRYDLSNLAPPTPAIPKVPADPTAPGRRRGGFGRRRLKRQVATEKIRSHSRERSPVSEKEFAAALSTLGGRFQSQATRNLFMRPKFQSHQYEAVACDRKPLQAGGVSRPGGSQRTEAPSRHSGTVRVPRPTPHPTGGAGACSDRRESAASAMALRTRSSLSIVSPWIPIVARNMPSPGVTAKRSPSRVLVRLLRDLAAQGRKPDRALARAAPVPAGPATTTRLALPGATGCPVHSRETSIPST